MRRSSFLLLALACAMASTLALTTRRHAVPDAEAAQRSQPAVAAPLLRPAQRRQGDAAVWIPDSRTIRKDLYGDPMPAGAVARLGTVRYRCGLIWDLDISPDNRQAAVVSYGGLDLVDLKTGKHDPVFSDRFPDLFTAAFTKDGTHLVAGSTHGNVKLVRVNDGEVERSFAGPSKRIEKVRPSPDGTRVAGLSEDGTLSIWVVDAEDAVCVFKVPTPNPQTLAWSPDGMRVAAGGGDGNVYVYGIKEQRLQKTLEGHRGWVQALSFSPNGRWLASGAAGGWEGTELIRIWDLNTGRLARTLDAGLSGTRWLSYAPDGSRLAVGTLNTQCVQMHDLESNRLQWEAPTGQNIWAGAFSRDGTVLATGSPDGVLRILDASDGSRLHSDDAPGDRFQHLIATRDGRTVITAGGSDGTVRFWDPMTGTETRRLALKDVMPEELALSPDERFLAVFACSKVWSGGAINLYTFPDGEPVAQWPAHRWAAGRLLFTPDGKALLTSSEKRTLEEEGDDTSIRMWEIPSGRALRAFEGMRSGCHDLALSPDGQRLAGAGQHGQVCVWETATGRLLKDKSFRNLFAEDLLFVDSESLRFSHNNPAGVTEWNWHTDESGRVFEYAGFAARNEGFFRDAQGRSLVCIAERRLTIFREALSGKPLQSVYFPDGGFVRLVLDGRYLLTSGNRTALVWDSRLFTQATDGGP